MEMDRVRQSLPAINMNVADEEHRSTRSLKMHKQQSGIFIADLPPNLRKIVHELGLDLDLDGDGRMDTKEIIVTVEHLALKEKANTSLKKIIWLLCAFAVFLAVTLFATSITAARLAKDTNMDPVSGIMYATGDAHSVMKTEEAESRSNTGIAGMTNEQLDILKAILPGTGDVKFQVKGYARRGTIDGNQVILLVEGGTITYDSQGIRDASGYAKNLLTFAYGDFTTGFLARKSTVVMSATS